MLFSKADLLGLLRLVWVLAAFVYKQTLENLSPQFVLRQHAAYCRFDDTSRRFLNLLARSREPLSAGVTGVSDVLLLIHFFAGQNQVIRIDHNNIVSAVYVRCEAGFVFTA